MNRMHLSQAQGLMVLSLDLDTPGTDDERCVVECGHFAYAFDHALATRLLRALDQTEVGRVGTVIIEPRDNGFCDISTIAKYGDGEPKLLFCNASGMQVAGLYSRTAMRPFHESVRAAVQTFPETLTTS